MADKQSQLVLDALRRAAASPAGALLYATRHSSGLFPAVSAAKTAVRKCLDEGWLVLRPGSPEAAALTDAGLNHLADCLSPREVLEDFVRAVESRQAQNDELIRTVRESNDQLGALQAAVQQMLSRLSSSPSIPSAGAQAMPIRTSPEIAADPIADLMPTVLARIGDYSASAGAGQDCPLPELYAGLGFREPPPSIGTFHDCLRRLHTQRRIYLHPWTGPLYALPEPSLALLVGHEVAYYASIRS